MLPVRVVVQEAVVLHPVLPRAIRGVRIVRVNQPLRRSRVGAHGTFIPVWCRPAEVAVVVPIGAEVAVFEFPVVAVAAVAVGAVLAGLVGVRVQIRVFGELLCDLVAQFLRVVRLDVHPDLVPWLVLSPSIASGAVLASAAFEVTFPGAVALLA